MAEKKFADSITVNSACETTFSFETNGYHGGDGGHGGYLQIVIDGRSSTMMNIAVDDEPLSMSAGGDVENKVTLRFLGDCEMANVAKGFEFLAARIRESLGPETV